MVINSNSVLVGRVVATLHHMSDEGRHVAKRIMDIFSIIPQIIIFYNLSLSWIHRGRNDRGGALSDYFIEGGGGSQKGPTEGRGTSHSSTRGRYWKLLYIITLYKNKFLDIYLI